MRAYSTTLFKYAALAALVLQCTFVFGQMTPGKFVGDNITRLENTTTEKKTLAQTKAELEVIYKQATNAQDDILQARSLNALIKVNDQLTEDSLYFRNSAVIDTLLYSANTSPKLKSILYVMQAKRVARFDQASRKFNIGEYRLKNLINNYAALRTDQRNALSNKYLDSALLGAAFFKDGAKELTWLSANPDVFLFEPKFEDIVLYEKISITTKNIRIYTDRRVELRNMLAMSTVRFNQVLDSLAAAILNDDKIKVLGHYRYWMAVNQSNEAIRLYIESLARKSIYFTVDGDSVAYNSYKQYLLNAINSPHEALRAHSVYQLCLLWAQEGKKYKDFNDNFSRRDLGSPLFSPQYQYLPAKTIQLYQQNSVLMDKYPVFKQVLDIMARQMQARALRVETNSNFLPGEAIPLKATYKNTDTLYYSIIKIGINEPAGKTITTGNSIKKQRPLLTGVFALPLPADNNVHATHLKLDALPVGRYRILFSYTPLNKLNDTLTNICINVTDISAINADERVYVLNRQTGHPIVGAAIKAYLKKSPVVLPLAKLTSNGYINIKNGVADSLVISYKGDTLGYAINLYRSYVNEPTSSSNDIKNLSAFYDKNTSMEVFTDRGLYRPGQTVQYKIVLLTRHPKTGRGIIFNEHNLGSGVFKAIYKNWTNNNKNYIVLRDAFGKKVDSVRIKTNGFGSFAGSFIIPKTASTGAWAINSGLRANYANSGMFKVEEYKRPTIELTMEKQSGITRPGEPFVIKLKLRSFNGSNLNNALVKYTIARSGSTTLLNNPNITEYINKTVLDTTGYTNAKGELSISINDTLLRKTILPDSINWSYSYSLNAKATDLAGESTELINWLTVSSHPINIAADLTDLMDRQALPVLKIHTSNSFEGDIARKVNVKIFKTGNPNSGGRYIIKEVDQWYYSESQWKSWFPDKRPPEASVVRTLVLDTVINTAVNGKLTLNKRKFAPGFYELEALTKDDDHTLGQLKQNFRVFDSQTGQWVGAAIDHLPVASVSAGKQVNWYVSTEPGNYAIYHSLYVNKANRPVNSYQTLTEKRAIAEWKYTVPADATGQIVITRISLKNNDMKISQRSIYVATTARPDAEIVVERYRKVMLPGAEETFSVSVKTRNNNVAAELMTTLYDASLDKLQWHRWEPPYTDARQMYVNAYWRYSSPRILIGEYSTSNPNIIDLIRYSPFERDLYNGLHGRILLYDSVEYLARDYKVSGNATVDEMLKKAEGFEVGLNGYINIRGSGVIRARLNGRDYAGGDVAQAVQSLPADLVEKFQVVDNYGDQAGRMGDGSASGQQAPVIKIRKNFNEIAFFFAQVHADKEGYYTFRFTMPETATEWNWKMLAHTRDARFAYVEKKLQTQLNLMVQPNMPRLLYQGDKIKLQSRISNLDTLAMTGKATLKIEDAVTGEDITALLASGKETEFNLDKKSTGSVAFMLSIPAGQTNPLKIVVTATGGGAADAEEHIIPVLSPKVFIRQSVRVRFDDKATVTINKPTLPAEAINYGLGISINQQPQASLIYALPWLANYSFDCAEQTFNKLRAQATALKLMQKDTSVQSAFKRAKIFMEKEQSKTDALPDEMAEATMPWLTLTNNIAGQQKQMFRLLDTSVTKTNIDKHLRRLYTLQKSDGGLSWFEGGESNSYISTYVLAGFGQLKQTNWAADRMIAYQQQNFIDKLANYGQSKLTTNDVSNSEWPYLLYALSYWLKDQPLSSEQSIVVNSMLEKDWSNIAGKNLQQQALLIISTMRYLPQTNALHAKADVQLENIRQMAIQDDVNGIRWKAIADAESMNTSAEETMALLAEAFELSGKYKDVQAGIVKWLLIAKQQQHWQTTKATAAAITMLQKEKGGSLGGVKAFSADIAGKQLNVSDALLDGKPADFMAAKETAANITIKQTGINATGAVTWYYFAKPDGLDTLSKTVKINKQFFIYDGNGRTTKAMTRGMVLKPGDRLQVKLTVEAAVSLQYVHINDPRAALFEPGENTSGHRYAKGLGYYQSVRDTGLELFTEAMPRGITEFTYDVVVAHSGEFNSGPATLQCMYQPALTAYSSTRSFKAE